MNTQYELDQLSSQTCGSNIVLFKKKPHLLCYCNRNASRAFFPFGDSQIRKYLIEPKFRQPDRAYAPPGKRFRRLIRRKAAPPGLSRTPGAPSSSLVSWSVTARRRARRTVMQGRPAGLPLSLDPWPSGMASSVPTSQAWGGAWGP